MKVLSSMSNVEEGLSKIKSENWLLASARRNDVQNEKRRQKHFSHYNKREDRICGTGINDLLRLMRSQVIWYLYFPTKNREGHYLRFKGAESDEELRIWDCVNNSYRLWENKILREKQ